MQAACLPPGSLPAIGIFLPGKVCYYPVAANAKWLLSALPEPSSFVCSKPNWDREGTYTNDCLYGVFLGFFFRFMHEHQYFKPVDCSCRRPRRSHSSAVP